MSCAKALFCFSNKQTPPPPEEEEKKQENAGASTQQPQDGNSRTMTSSSVNASTKSVYFDAVEDAADMKDSMYFKQTDPSTTTTTKEKNDEKEEEVVVDRVIPLADGDGDGGAGEEHKRMTMTQPSELLSKRTLTKRESMRTFRRRRRAEFSSSLRKVLTLGIAKEGKIAMEDRGYPGFLTEKELEIAQTFHGELQKRDPVYKEMVYAWDRIEEEPYSLCRFLRARDFKVEEVFKMLDEAIGIWNEAKAANFYPEPDKALGNPVRVLLTQYPMVKIGMAKNKCPVSYLKAGMIHSEGVECVTTLEDFTKYIWYDNMHQFTKFMAGVQRQDPDVVRMEVVSVFDLEGLTSSQLNGKTMDVMKAASAVAICFPESLNALIVMNAPGYFSFTWRIIKGFLPPRTASKIEVHSNRKTGLKRLEELIGYDQLPADYGGKLISTTEKMRQSGGSAEASEGGGGDGGGDSSGGGVQRQIVELLHVKSKKDKQFELAANETCTLTVYTRSFGGANFAIQKEGSEAETLVENVFVQGKGTEEEPFPNGMELISNVKGPGTFDIHVEAKVSKGTDHFLVIGDVYEAS